ncbi:hypothetical protein B506_02833 [Lactobacillus delbrueckii subsp. jakobsenii ZN7a-9 = DSM 26046]|nr:hypothetical protein B506_02833 [Lactobacillus delbrueckii subsp. jakobsenii ZN7a-9 = DSM 26046]
MKMRLGALGDQASFGTSFSYLNGPNIYIGRWGFDHRRRR